MRSELRSLGLFRSGGVRANEERPGLSASGDLHSVGSAPTASFSLSQVGPSPNNNIPPNTAGSLPQGSPFRGTSFGSLLPRLLLVPLSAYVCKPE